MGAPIQIPAATRSEIRQRVVEVLLQQGQVHSVAGAIQCRPEAPIERTRVSQVLGDELIDAVRAGWPNANAEIAGNRADRLLRELIAEVVLPPEAVEPAETSE